MRSYDLPVIDAGINGAGIARESRLVREASIERERLFRTATHSIWPLRFLLPWTQGCGR